MDIEGKDEDVSEYSQPLNDLEAISYDEGVFLEGFEHPYFKGGIVRVPLSLLHNVAATAQRIGSGRYPYDAVSRLSETWMKAIALKFPDTPLGELRSTDPSLLPRWLLERCAYDQDLVVLQPGGIFARSDLPNYSAEPGPNAESILAASLHCRFREGFASEGMLCNDPPIPLRVLDFLEHAEDLLNLALVCKAAHKAGHVLLQREFRHDVYSKYNDFETPIERRKKSMLESALRHPIPNTAASTSTLAPKTRTGADTEERDHLCESFVIGDGEDCLDQLMSTLLRATKSPESDPIMPPPPVNQVDPVLLGRISMLNWRQHLYNAEFFPVVMDGEAVKRAEAMLEDFDLEILDARAWENRCARKVMQIVHAAKREGQGLILHDCFFDAKAYDAAFYPPPLVCAISEPSGCAAGSPDANLSIGNLVMGMNFMLLPLLSH